jgi:predicted HD superfamily hydrolase involved in NAD metabolism
VHDLARLFPTDRLTSECKRRGLPIDAFERRHPIVLHAPLGAELARERFAIDDPAVLSAIRKHTLADSDMTRLDTLVYLADALEPGREYAERSALEALACRDPEAAMAAVLRSSLRYLEARGLEAAPRTRAALAAFEALERSPLSA